MIRVSTLFKERPQKPLETAIWWTDFVLRHSQDELAVLRPLSVGQSWWKKRQLDVWAAIFGVTVITSMLFLYILFKVLKYLCSSNSNTQRNTSSEKRNKKIQ